MFKYIFTAAFFCTFGLSFAQTNTFLSGKIINPNGDSVYVFQMENVDGKMKRQKLGVSALKNGEFSIKMDIKEAVDATFSDGNENCPLLLAPGDNLNLTINTRYFDETIRFSGVGCEKNNAAMILYLIQETMFEKIYSSLDELDTTTLFNTLKSSNDEYIATIQDYIDHVKGFENYGKDLLETAKQSVGEAKEYYKAEIEFKNLMAKIEGKPAIDFEGIDLNGKKIKLSDFKGKMIVVDFWATWCAPCRAEFPAYKELEEKYGKEINFVSVGAFCKEKEWNKMATAEGFKNNIFISKEAEAQLNDYVIKGIPRYMVIDADFKLINANAERPSSGKLPSYWLK